MYREIVYRSMIATNIITERRLREEREEILLKLLLKSIEEYLHDLFKSEDPTSVKFVEDIMNKFNCVICHDIPTLPVLPIGCHCKVARNYYCLTCWRDGSGMNRYDFSISICPLCRGIVSHKGAEVYQLDEDLCEKLDNIFGDATCPRCLTFKGKRIFLRAHLRLTCPKSYKPRHSLCY